MFWSWNGATCTKRFPVYLRTRYRSKLGWFFWFGPIHGTIRRNLATKVDGKSRGSSVYSCNFSILMDSSQRGSQKSFFSSAAAMQSGCFAHRLTDHDSWSQLLALVNLVIALGRMHGLEGAAQFWQRWQYHHRFSWEATKSCNRESPQKLGMP